MFFIFFFFFKQKTAYEMRISDWSSDVCSSDLPRLVDTSQYIQRLRARDFDMMIIPTAQSLSPGNEQREYWGSAAADEASSRNYAGIKDPVVDELIELMISAPSRESLIQRTRALDRVLLWGHYVIPQLDRKSTRLNSRH